MRSLRDEKQCRECVECSPPQPFYLTCEACGFAAIPEGYDDEGCLECGLAPCEVCEVRHHDDEDHRPYPEVA
jgi:hypothetical protein